MAQPDLVINLGMSTGQFVRASRAAQKQAEAFEGALLGLGKAAGGARGTGGGAQQAVFSLAQTIQDAPFGIRGMANNIEFLTQNLLTLTRTTGGAVAALRAVGATLMGPAGILLGVSAVTAGIQLFAGSWEDAADAAETSAERIGKATSKLVGEIELLTPEGFDVAIGVTQARLRALQNIPIQDLTVEQGAQIRALQQALGELTERRIDAASRAIVQGVIGDLARSTGGGGSRRGGSRRRGEGGPAPFAERPGFMFGGLGFAGQQGDIRGDLEIDGPLAPPTAYDAMAEAGARATEMLKAMNEALDANARAFQQNLRDAGSFFGGLSDLSEIAFESATKHNETFFMAFKSFAIAEGLLNAYAAGTRAAREGRWWAVAASVTQALALVQRMKSVRPDRGGGDLPTGAFGFSAARVRQAGAPRAFSGTVQGSFAPAAPQTVRIERLQVMDSGQHYRQIAGRF